MAFRYRVILTAVLTLALLSFLVLNYSRSRMNSSNTSIEHSPPRPEGAYWNSWVERTGDLDGEPVQDLLAQACPGYSLVFGLSLFHFENWFTGYAWSAEPDPGLAKVLRDARAQGLETYKVVARATVLGDAVRIVRGSSQEVSIDLTKLEPIDLDALDREAFPTPGALSKQVGAAEFEIELEAIQAGCAAVAVSISRNGDPRPLDHLVRMVRVVDDTLPAPDCYGSSSVFARPLSAGLSTLLVHRNAPRLDAALHVFEVEIEGRPTAAGFLINSQGNHWAWELGQPLSEYLQDEGNLQAAVSRARRDDREPGKPPDYGPAALQLRSVLFSGANAAERAKAKKALTALQEIAFDAPTPPTVLARFVDSSGKFLFMPLRLLSAGGASGVLPGPVEVVFPLPNEDYTASATCVDSWTVAIPSALLSELDNELRFTRPQSDRIRYLDDSIESLREYLADSSKPQSEGLLVLAHHSRGRLYYGHGDDPVLASQMTRQYGPGSVVVLVTCTAGGPTNAELRIMNELNRAGVQTFILSPFELPAYFGAAFAIGFAEALQSAEQEGRTSSISQLFQQASSRARILVKEHQGVDIGEMDLELLIAGNHSVRLCSPEDPQ